MKKLLLERINTINKMRIYLLLSFLISSIVSMAQDDVDTRIAVNDQGNPNTFVVIIANENYKYEHSVPFALNDGETFKLYCEKTLGIPVKNIHYVADATLNDMRMQVQWLREVMNAYGGEAHAIVYYSGHGMPDDATRQAFLLPVDGNSAIPESGLSTAWLYKELGIMPSAGTILFLDACFSGTRRDGQMLISQSKGIALKPKQDMICGNMVVFSASQAGETAYPYQGKQHGLFTYFLLEQLQNKGGYISLGELGDEVIKQVSRLSIVENNKSQTPNIFASATAHDWEKWTLTSTRANKYEIIKRNTIQKAQEPDVITQPLTATPSSSKQTPQGLVFTVKGVSFTMIPVKGGTFMMGATEEQGSEVRENERPVHQVTVSDYYIGETEVTQELWEVVMGNNPSFFKSKGKNYPVESICWDDCQDFINELNSLTNQQFRLPTEAEWEFAARGGNEGRPTKFSGSNSYEIVAQEVFETEGYTRYPIPSQVKTKKANELGIYDMTGNVNEWCSDSYGVYPKKPQVDPKGPKKGSSTKVYRGGGFNSGKNWSNISHRGWSEQKFSKYINDKKAFSGYGLRLAL